MHKDKKGAVTRKFRSGSFLPGKKGFGDAVSTLIMFIAVVSVSTGLVIAIKNYALSTQDSISFQNKVVNNQLKTSIDITNMVYNSTSNNTYVYLKNIGETKLETQLFDFFLDDVYITNYSVYYAEDTSKSMNMLMPGETALFIKNKFLSSGTHSVKLVSGYG